MLLEHKQKQLVQLLTFTENYKKVILIVGLRYGWPTLLMSALQAKSLSQYTLHHNSICSLS